MTLSSFASSGYGMWHVLCIQQDIDKWVPVTFTYIVSLNDAEVSKRCVKYFSGMCLCLRNGVTVSRSQMRIK